MTLNKDLIIKTRRDLHKIPEQSLKEHKTIKYIENFLKERNIDHSYITLTGIIAFVRAGSHTCPQDTIIPSSQNIIPSYPTIAIRADIDALEITESTNLACTSEHQGFMHACGHDFHMTTLLGIADYYSKPENIPPVNLMMIFQPAEEGAGGAKLMIENGLYDIYGKPDYIFGYHVKPDLKTGVVSAALGKAWAGTLSFNIKFLGDGGHGANPHKTQDLIMIFSQWYSHIQSFISRKLDAQESTVLTVGTIKGADRLNIIPSNLEIEGMLRYFNEEDKNLILSQMEESARTFAKLYGAEMEFEIIRDAIPLFNDAALLLNIEKYYLKNNSKMEYLPLLAREKPVMLAEDFPEFLRNTRGVFFFLGAQNEKPQQLHTPDLNLNENAMFYGVNFMIDLIKNWKSWV
jgi:amidohydrolase